jgi:hypothetical protein
MASETMEHNAEGPGYCRMHPDALYHVFVTTLRVTTVCVVVDRFSLLANGTAAFPVIKPQATGTLPCNLYHQQSKSLQSELIFNWLRNSPDLDGRIILKLICEV